MNDIYLSYSRVWKIIQEELLMSKLPARWIPRLRVLFQKQTRRDLPRKMLNLLEQDEEGFFHSLLTMKEFWIYQYY